MLSNAPIAEKFILKPFFYGHLVLCSVKS